MNRRQARSRPTAIATVRSKITVRKKVIRSTMTSDFGFFRRAVKDLHPLMLYETTTKTPARQAIGINLANGMRNSRISRSLL
jgi:hypothetical protein